MSLYLEWKTMLLFFVTLKFTNITTGQKSVYEINFGEIPIMTTKSTHL